VKAVAVAACAGQILLIVVEIGRDEARIALLGRHLVWAVMDAVRLCTLQHRQVLQAFRHGGQCVQKVDQHREIATDLVPRSPAGDERGLSLQCREDEMRDGPFAATAPARPAVKGQAAGGGWHAWFLRLPARTEGPPFRSTP
jgi:hypothetical protein